MSLLTFRQKFRCFSYFDLHRIIWALESSRAEMGSPLLPSSLDELHALWNTLCIIELLLSVTWIVSVSGVVDILGSVENSWEEEVVELTVGVINVILNTITVGIEDFVVSSLPGGASLEEIVLLHVLRAGEDHTPVGDVLLSLDERFLGSLELLLLLSSLISLSLGVLGISLGVDVDSWLWMISPSVVTWELSVSSVVDILNSWGKHHLSELIEGVLIVLDVVLNTITIGINNSSWLVFASDLRWSLDEDIRVFRWNVSSLESRKALGRDSAHKGSNNKLFIHFL